MTFDVEAGNRAISENKLPQLFSQLTEQLKPEAAYFCPDHGKRTAMFFVDMKDSSQLSGIAEPFFMTLNATVEFVPVMNSDDLQKGLAEYMRRR
ncbi:MAG TPA: hypothetical protein VJV74_09570 [Terriglobia bacterium]|nr:hypothetical protein [Terriglobia bacterium]